MKKKSTLVLLLTMLSFTLFAKDSFQGFYKSVPEGDLPINYSRRGASLKIKSLGDRELGKYNVTISSSTARPIFRDGELLDYNVYECTFDNIEFDQVDENTLIYIAESFFEGEEAREVVIKKLDDNSFKVSNTDNYSAFCGIHATINGPYLRN